MNIVIIKKANDIQNIRDELIAMGAEVNGDIVTLYRGGDVSESMLMNLRYNDYLSTVEFGKDAYGNSGASEYGKNIVRLELPINDIEIVNGEVQYKGKSNSLKGGTKYPLEIYRAYNDYHGSNYTAKEIDEVNFDDVHNEASMGLSGGKEEFDYLMSLYQQKKQADNINLIQPDLPNSDVSPDRDKTDLKNHFKKRKKPFRNESQGRDEILMDGMGDYRNQDNVMGTDNSWNGNI
ncbi:MAG: hypothetical protein PHS93_08310 [Candidatus Omnitrophica bacterium]|nr:hypothetical protein [Candidatus Omnitrophota bacterium]MDD5589136.1 hypothetical protein [Candidatus Nanoarchaeia archaeon]